MFRFIYLCLEINNEAAFRETGRRLHFVWVAGCLNQDSQDGRMFQDWGYPALSFYLGYPDSECGDKLTGTGRR